MRHPVDVLQSGILPLLHYVASDDSTSDDDL